MEAIAARIVHPLTRARAFERAAKAGEGGFAPPPPLLRKPGEFDWALLKNAAHWDWVQFIRDADATLPQTCLCLLWGRPALIHFRTGVIFAVAVGSIGVLARLPDDPPKAARAFDVTRLGPGWRLVDEGTGWAGRAFESSAVGGPEKHA